MKDFLENNISKEKKAVEGGVPFRLAFFRAYDPKISSGEITFADIKMSKDDFITLCTDKEFLPTREKAIDMAVSLKMTEAQAIEMLASVGYAVK